MSLENAILTHAAALSELAAAIRTMGGVWRPVTLTEGRGERIKGTITPAAADVVTPDADLDNAVTKVETDAAQAAAMKSVEDKKAKDKALAAAKAEAQAKKEAEEKAEAEATATAHTQTDGAGSSGDDSTLDVVLDYKADVRPALLAAIKRTSKEDVQALIKTFGVDKGEQIPADKLAEAKAKADALGL